jgi:hypothetical protein
MRRNKRVKITESIGSLGVPFLIAVLGPFFAILTFLPSWSGLTEFPVESAEEIVTKVTVLLPLLVALLVTFVVPAGGGCRICADAAGREHKQSCKNERPFHLCLLCRIGV